MSESQLLLRPRNHQEDKDCSGAVFPRHNTVCAHRSSQGLWQHAQDQGKIKPDKMLEERNELKVPKLQTIDDPQERIYPCSSRQSYIPTNMGNDQWACVCSRKVGVAYPSFSHRNIFLWRYLFKHTISMCFH